MDTSQNTFYEPNDLLLPAACTSIVLIVLRRLVGKQFDGEV